MAEKAPARISAHEELHKLHKPRVIVVAPQRECRRRPLPNATATRSVDSICEHVAVAAAQQSARNDSGASTLCECQ